MPVINKRTIWKLLKNASKTRELTGAVIGGSIGAAVPSDSNRIENIARGAFAGGSIGGAINPKVGTLPSVLLGIGALNTTYNMGNDIKKSSSTMEILRKASSIKRALPRMLAGSILGGSAAYGGATLGNTEDSTRNLLTALGALSGAVTGRSAYMVNRYGTGIRQMRNNLNRLVEVANDINTPTIFRKKLYPRLINNRYNKLLDYKNLQMKTLNHGNVATGATVGIAALGGVNALRHDNRSDLQKWWDNQYGRLA